MHVPINDYNVVKKFKIINSTNPADCVVFLFVQTLGICFIFGLRDFSVR